MNESRKQPIGSPIQDVAPVERKLSGPTRSRRTMLRNFGGGLLGVGAVNWLRGEPTIHTAPLSGMDVGIIYVAVGGDDGNNGLTWATTKSTIADALAAVSGAEFKNLE